jgi:hypothetical protein
LLSTDKDFLAARLFELEFTQIIERFERSKMLAKLAFSFSEDETNLTFHLGHDANT